MQNPISRIGLLPTIIVLGEGVPFTDFPSIIYQTKWLWTLSVEDNLSADQDPRGQKYSLKFKQLKRAFWDAASLYVRTPF